MSPIHATSRRELLLATGSAVALGLAGCLESGAASENPGATPSPSPSDVEDADHSHHEGEDGHHHEDVPDHASPTAEVRMLTSGDSHHFSPHVAWVEAGGTVTFVNESGAHSATAYAPDNDKPRRIPEGGTAFDTELLSEAGAEVTVTLEEPGVYDYYCIPHEGVGMIGSIIVGEPDPHGQPGLSEPTDVPESTHDKLHELNEMVNEALGHGHEDSTPSGDGATDEHDDSTDGHDDSTDDHDDGHGTDDHH